AAGRARAQLPQPRSRRRNRPSALLIEPPAKLLHLELELEQVAHDEFQLPSIPRVPPIAPAHDRRHPHGQQAAHPLPNLQGQPGRVTSRSSSTRSSLICVATPTSPISSRKIVPSSASSNRPSRRSAAPVKAPFSCPNSSLSSSVSGSAPTLTAMNGLFLRGLN